jgi:hypothetical protein
MADLSLERCPYTHLALVASILHGLNCAHLVSLIAATTAATTAAQAGVVDDAQAHHLGGCVVI